MMAVDSSFIDRPISPPQYNQLLIVIVLRLLIIPFVHRGLGDIVASVLVFYITFLIVQSYQLKRSLFIFFVFIAIVGFLVDIMLALGWIASEITPILTVQIIYALFFGSAALLILQRVLQASRVTMDIVRGGVCVYLLLGYFWSLLYGIVYILDTNAFSSELVTETSYSNVLYFSFITLTTLGYGDIVPVTEIASILTVLEALVGQIYPAVFIALLVSGYLAHQHLPEE
ncbi:potassium channel family protein [Vacuolonema iberomarrocanum]|uniref:potassium channel family protein n=1 Tax=Vacuolonema iberomarrocanum TaxID=3454632 RepID=UPI001A03DF61|nr:two pore domain potassium channel family protein [filamentous cyanobacterium LEGE 07170]